MNQVAPDVIHLPLAPRDTVNAYLLGDVLVDAGTGGMGKKLAQRLRGRTLSAHALTHAHPDHAGGSKAVVDAFGVPYWVGARDVFAAEHGRPVKARTLAPPARWHGVPVARELREGDEVGAGFRVVESFGHSPGHVAFFRESDRVLVGGDVWFNVLFPRVKPGLRDPFGMVTVNPEENRASQRKLAELEPSLALFGHGPPVRDAAAKLRAYVDGRGA
jgi:hydroxyacylglutathione hydrolase